MISWLIALLACRLPDEETTGSDGPDLGTDSGASSDGEGEYLGQLDMHWQESAIVYREGECKLPLTLDLDDAGNITGGVTCEMADTGETSLDFTGALVGGTITGTVEFADSGFSWTDAWSGDLADEALSGVFEGYYEAGADAAWSYEGSFTLGP